MTDTPYTAPAAFHAHTRSVLIDYAKAIFTLAIFGGLWSMAIPGSVIWFVIGFFFFAFIAYLGNTLWRHGLRLELDDRGVTAGWHNPLDATGMILLQKRRIPWDELKTLKVRHFNRKREAKNFDLLVAKMDGVDADGKKVSITFDGGHEGFQPVLAAAWAAAQARQLFFDEATLANLESIGIDTREGEPWTS